MTSPYKERLIPTIWLAFGLMLFAGCASRPHAKALPPPPSEEVRASLGTIGFASAGSLTNSLLQKPRTRGGATAAGAGMGALWGLGAGAQASRGGGSFGGAVAACVCMVTVPVGTLVGAAVGNREGMPVRERQHAEEKLQKAVLETDVQQMLKEEVARLIREKTPVSIVGPDARTGKPPAESTIAAAPTNVVIDTTLEVTVVNAGLCGSRDRSSPLSAFLEARVRLVRARDGVELYAHTWVPRAGVATLENWAADDAYAMRQELRRMVPSLAESVVEEVFLVYDPKQSGKRK